MKRWIAVGAILGWLAGTAGLAGAAEVEALVEDGYWAFWLKPEAKLTELGSDSAGLVGGQLGIAMSRSLYVGFGYYTLVSSVEFDGAQAGRLGSSDLWYMGVDVGYTLYPTRVVHPALDLLVGWGESSPRLTVGGTDASDLFVVEPGISLLVNLTKEVEFGIGLSYRFVDGSDTAGLPDSDLSGLTGNLFLRWTESR